MNKEKKKNVLLRIVDPHCDSKCVRTDISQQRSAVRSTAKFNTKQKKKNIDFLCIFLRKVSVITVSLQDN